MAGQRNVDATVFFAVFLGIVNVAFGVTTYIFNNTATIERGKASKAEADRRASDAAAKALRDEVDVLKQTLGFTGDKVGDANTLADATTVMGMASAELDKSGGAFKQASVVETLKRLRQEIETVSGDRDGLRNRMNRVENSILVTEQTKLTEELSKRDEDKKTSENELKDEIRKYAETLESEAKKIDALRADIKRVNEELKEFRIINETLRIKKEDSLVNLRYRRSVLDQELAYAKAPSFDKANGRIATVNHDLGSVTIDIGKRQFLRPQTRFRVYRKNVAGNSRGPEDENGEIEVTRVLSDTTSECRIVRGSSIDPISVGDLIHSAIWHPGYVEKFALIGEVDFDGDLVTDRKLLRDMISGQGLGLQTEVDDHGVRTGGAINEQTKYLVRGRIPDLTDDLAEDHPLRKIHAHLAVLRQEALEHGVKTISLSDFIAYSGIKVRRR